MNTAQNLQMFDIYAQHVQSVCFPSNDTLTSRKLALDSLSSTECNEHVWPLTLALPVKFVPRLA